MTTESDSDVHTQGTGQAAERLDSWKEIAAFLKRDVTTVQRWEKREGMPVHRHVHEKLGSVFAFRGELDAWVRNRNLRANQANEAVSNALGCSDASGSAAPVTEAPHVLANSPAHRGRVLWWIAATVLALSTAGFVAYVTRRTRSAETSLAAARRTRLADFGGAEQAAAISRDGRFVTFLSDRDGPVDVWLTQVGTGQYYNLTRGGFRELANPSVRTLGFSPDGSLATFWARNAGAANAGDIGIWAVPILGGQPHPYLEGVAEFDWSSDGARLVYHTPAPGDPTFVKRRGEVTVGQPIFVAPAGLHAHFPQWSPAHDAIYFVQGSLPNALDIWRIPAAGGSPERLTQHSSHVSHPVFLDPQTLLYLANDPDGSGPWLYSIDLQRRISRRVDASLERYTSLAASSDARRLVATLANVKRSLWRVPIAEKSSATRISLSTGQGSLPELGPNYLLYVASKHESDAIWKLADNQTTELWSAAGVRILGSPTIAPDGRRVAFTVEQQGRTRLIVMNADGTAGRSLADSVILQGTPAWAPDGASIVSAVLGDGIPRLYRIFVDGRPPDRLTNHYAIDPVWDPNGQFIVYSGPDVGTTFPVKSLAVDGSEHVLPPLWLDRGARRLRFLPGQRALIFLRGDLQHKNLCRFDLETGEQQQLVDLEGFDIRGFDVADDGREVVLDRAQELSSVVLIDRAAER